MAAPVTPSAVPPPTATAVEVVDAQRKARMGRALGRGFGQRSIRAGETASGTNYQSPAGETRLLGG